MIGIGIVGLPNVGKSTLFNAITKTQNAEAANYPFATIEPNVGIVSVPDLRLDEIAKIINPKRVLGASVEFVDIAGLVKGAANDENIIHVEGSVDPIRDIEIINGELILSDAETVENAIQKNSKQAKNNKDAKRLVEVLEKCKLHLDEYKMLSSLNLEQDELDLISTYQLLTLKPMMFGLNISEEDLVNSVDNDHVKRVKEYAESINAECVTFSAKVESELIEIEDENERNEFIESLGIKEPSLNRFIRCGFHLLGLISYFTAGEQEVRAWTIKKGTLAPRAAREIHSDIERGFIRAEVVEYNKFIEYKGWQGSKEKGAMRLEGKEYEVKDGDVMFFRFNV